MPSLQGGESESAAGGLCEDPDAAGRHGARIHLGVRQPAHTVLLKPRVRSLEVVQGGGVGVLRGKP